MTNLKELKIKVESYRNKTGPAQCHRCQGFFHSAIGCHIAPKCVKCGQNHLTKDCTKSKEEPPKCGNCGQDHPANYKGCPKYPTPNNKKNQQQKRQNKIFINRSYADALKSTENEKQQNTLQEAKAVLSDLKGLVGILNTLPQLKEIVNKLQEEEK